MIIYIACLSLGLLFTIISAVAGHFFGGHDALFEELRHDGENFEPTPHAKIRRFMCRAADLAPVQKQLQHLAANIHRLAPKHIKLALHGVIPEYTPYLTSNEPVGAQEPHAKISGEPAPCLPNGLPKAPVVHCLIAPAQ